MCLVLKRPGFPSYLQKEIPRKRDSCEQMVAGGPFAHEGEDKSAEKHEQLHQGFQALSLKILRIQTNAFDEAIWEIHENHVRQKKNRIDDKDVHIIDN